MKWLGVGILIAILLSGCSPFRVYAPGLGVVSSDRSEFDGRERVEAIGNHVRSAEQGSRATFDEVLIGARWQSTDPDTVQIVLTTVTWYDKNQYAMKADALVFDVNGQAIKYPVLDGGIALVPLPDLAKILSARSCKVKVLSGGYSGYFEFFTKEGDFAISTNGFKSYAKGSIEKFYSVVQAKSAKPSQQ